MHLQMRQIIRVARPGFWATQIWFYMLPLGGHDVLGHWPFWIGAFYVTFPLSLLLYGWNDVVDYETDQLNLRKGTYLFGARCSKEELKRIPLVIGLVQLPFIALFVWKIGIVFLFWVVAAVIVNAAYNVSLFALKSRPFFDLANQVGYLLVFVLSSWLNGVPQLPPGAFIFGGLFAMHSHLLGQLMDYDPDRKAGRRTTAVVIGVIPSKWLLAGILSAEA